MTAALAGNPALHLLALPVAGCTWRAVPGSWGWAPGMDDGGMGARPTIVLGRWASRRWRGISACVWSAEGAQHLSPAPWTADGHVERLAALPLPGWGPIQWRRHCRHASSYLVSHVTLCPRP